MHRALLLLLALVVLPACGGLLPDRDDRVVHLRNQTDRPLVAFVVSAGNLPLIDPQPAMSAAAFDARRIDVGETARLDDLTEYDSGDDVGVFLYARNGPTPAHLVEQYGADAAPLVAVKVVSAAELQRQSYTVIVRDLRS